MKSLSKHHLKMMSLFFLGTILVLFSAKTVNADPAAPPASPVNPECRCMHTDKKPLTEGTWETACYDTTQKKFMICTGDLCPKSGASGACNPLTDAVVNGPFPVPTLGDLLGSLIKIFFFIAGLMSLLYLLLGAFEWVRSGGKEEDIEGAQKKIMAAIIGLIVMVAVLTLVIVIEQVIFRGTICLGISCPFKLGDIGIVSPN
ncbi:MAG: hypothetical protein WCJ70_04555 [bacterium]